MLFAMRMVCSAIMFYVGATIMLNHITPPYWVSAFWDFYITFDLLFTGITEK